MQYWVSVEQSSPSWESGGMEIKENVLQKSKINNLQSLASKNSKSVDENNNNSK